MSNRLVSRPAFLISVATAFSLLGDQMLYSVLPTYFTEIGLMPYQVGLVLSVNRFIRLITNHLAEYFCRQIRLNILIVLAFGLGTAVTVAYAYVTHFGLLILARTIWGLCWSFIRQIGLMTVVESSSDENLGRSMGVYSGVSRTGSVVGNLVGAIGHDTLGFIMTLIGFSAISILAIPLGLISRKGLHPYLKREALGESGNSNPLGLLFCGFVVGCVGTGLVMSTLGLVLLRVVGDSVAFIGVTIGVASLNGLFLSARWITDSIGAPVLGHVGDLFGRNRVSVLFFTVGTATLLLVPMMDTLVGIGLSVMVFFVCGVGLTTILMAQAGRLGSKTTARYVTSMDFGSALGPALGWTSQQFVSSTDVIFIMGAVLYATGIIASRFIDRISEAASSEVMK